jgi:N-acetylglucosaminyl-diphospho-decaprenol L-rhamnosyltransferase
MSHQQHLLLANLDSDVSIAVVSYNTRDLLARCLNSIRETAADLNVETIVVDNASSDGSPEMVARDFPEAGLIRNEDNLGFAVATNQAVRISQGRYILLLNSDALLLPHAVQRMVSFMDSHPKAGVVGAQLLNPDSSFQSSYADFPDLFAELLLITRLAHAVYPRTYPSHPAAESQHERVVDWVFGACLMARRDAVEAVGLLDEDYFMYTEETDWCYRMRQSGWLVHYLPSARVIHWSGQSALKVPERKRSQLYRSKWLFMRKHRGRVTAGLFRVAVLILSSLKLMAWALTCLSSDASRRGRGLQNVRSYALLLSKF